MKLSEFLGKYNEFMNKVRNLPSFYGRFKTPYFKEKFRGIFDLLNDVILRAEEDAPLDKFEVFMIGHSSSGKTTLLKDIFELPQFAAETSTDDTTGCFLHLVPGGSGSEQFGYLSLESFKTLYEKCWRIEQKKDGTPDIIKDTTLSFISDCKPDSVRVDPVCRVRKLDKAVCKTFPSWKPFLPNQSLKDNEAAGKYAAVNCLVQRVEVGVPTKSNIPKDIAEKTKIIKFVDSPGVQPCDDRREFYGPLNYFQMLKNNYLFDTESEHCDLYMLLVYRQSAFRPSDIQEVPFSLYERVSNIIDERIPSELLHGSPPIPRPILFVFSRAQDIPTERAESGIPESVMQHFVRKHSQEKTLSILSRDLYFFHTLFTDPSLHAPINLTPTVNYLKDPELLSVINSHQIPEMQRMFKKNMELMEKRKGEGDLSALLIEFVTDILEKYGILFKFVRHLGFFEEFFQGFPSNLFGKDNPSLALCQADATCKEDIVDAVRSCYFECKKRFFDQRTPIQSIRFEHDALVVNTEGFPIENSGLKLLEEIWNEIDPAEILRNLSGDLEGIVSAGCLLDALAQTIDTVTLSSAESFRSENTVSDFETIQALEEAYTEIYNFYYEVKNECCPGGVRWTPRQVQRRAAPGEEGEEQKEWRDTVQEKYSSPEEGAEEEEPKEEGEEGEEGEEKEEGEEGGEKEEEKVEEETEEPAESEPSNEEVKEEVKKSTRVKK